MASDQKAIPWHAELFRCPLNGYIPCYVTLKSSAPPPPSACALICIKLKARRVYLLLGRQANLAKRLNTVLLVSGGALVIVGRSLLLCLLPV